MGDRVKTSGGIRGGGVTSGILDLDSWHPDYASLLNQREQSETQRVEFRKDKVYASVAVDAGLLFEKLTNPAFRGADTEHPDGPYNRALGELYDYALAMRDNKSFVHGTKLSMYATHVGYYIFPNEFLKSDSQRGGTCWAHASAKFLQRYMLKENGAIGMHLREMLPFLVPSTLHQGLVKLALGQSDTKSWSLQKNADFFPFLARVGPILGAFFAIFARTENQRDMAFKWMDEGSLLTLYRDSDWESSTLNLQAFAEKYSKFGSYYSGHHPFYYKEIYTDGGGHAMCLIAHNWRKGFKGLNSYEGADRKFDNVDLSVKGDSVLSTQKGLLARRSLETLDPLSRTLSSSEIQYTKNIHSTVIFSILSSPFIFLPQVDIVDWKLSPLHQVFKAMGCTDELSFCLNRPIEPSGFTVIHYAANHGKFEVLQALVRRGADPFLLTTNGESIVNYVGNDGSKSVIKFLWEFFNDSTFEFSAPADEGSDQIKKAFRDDIFKAFRDDIIKALGRNIQDMSAFLKNGKFQLPKKLAEFLKWEDFIFTQGINELDSNGLAAIHHVVRAARDTMQQDFEKLVSHGADPFLLDGDGGSVFYWAASSPSASQRIVDVLFRMFDDTSTKFLMPADEDSEKIKKAFRDDIIRALGQRTDLMTAFLPDGEGFKLPRKLDGFLGFTQGINELGSNGLAAIHHVVRAARDTMQQDFEKLVSHGADPFLLDGNGGSVWAASSLSASQRIVDVLFSMFDDTSTKFLMPADEDSETIKREFTDDIIIALAERTNLMTAFLPDGEGFRLPRKLDGFLGFTQGINELDSNGFAAIHHVVLAAQDTMQQDFDKLVAHGANPLLLDGKGRSVSYHRIPSIEQLDSEIECETGSDWSEIGSDKPDKVEDNPSQDVKSKLEPSGQNLGEPSGQWKFFPPTWVSGFFGTGHYKFTLTSSECGSFQTRFSYLREWWTQNKSRDSEINGYFPQDTRSIWGKSKSDKKDLAESRVEPLNKWIQALAQDQGTDLCKSLKTLKKEAN